jgi:hypothetical protein
MPPATRKPKPSTHKARSEPGTSDTTTEAEAKKVHESEALLADMQEAQFQFTRIADETYRQAMLRSSEAYQAYFEAISTVQRELSQRAFDAFQAFTTSTNAALDPGDVAKQCADAYEHYVTVVGELFDTSQALAKAHEANANYLKAVSAAQGQPDSEARIRDAYATYLDDLRNAWDKSAETQEANTSLQTWLDLLKLAQSHYQEQTFDAYRVYVETLRKAPVETDVLGRSEQAHDAYLKALREIWESARESFGNAAASTVLKTLQQAWSTG